MSVTAQANEYVNAVKDEIAIIGKEQEVIYYDTELRLWQCCTKEAYSSYIPDFYEKSKFNLRDAFEKYAKSEDDEDKKVLSKKIDIQIGLFDKDLYHASILKRSTGKLQNNQFVKKLDMIPHFFPIKNGKKINLQTLEVSDREKFDYFTFEAPVEYLENTPNANKFFKQVFSDDDNREYSQKSLGYMLTGDTSAQVFYIWYGRGRNGKSVTANMLKSIIGKFYHQCDKSIFIKTQKAHGASPEKMALIGRRVVIYSEGDTADEIDLNISSIKEVSGEDEINARGLFKDPINFKAQCKLSMLTNYVPPLDGQYAVVERLRMLFFDSTFTKTPKGKNEFKQDPEFVEKLVSEHLSEIFSWIARGSYAYYQTKTIKMPQSIQDRCTKLIVQEDSIESFLEKRLKVTNNKKDFIRRGALFDLYKLFCNANSQRCKPRSTLFNRLADMKIMSSTLDGYDVFRGIIISEEKEDTEEYKFNDEKDKCNNARVRSTYNIHYAKKSNDSEEEDESEDEPEEIKPKRRKGFGVIDNSDYEEVTIITKRKSKR